MAKAKEKEVLVLSIIIFAIVLVGYFQLLVRPNMRTLGQLSPTVARVKKDVEFARTAIANIDNLKRKLTLLETEVANYEARLPTQKEVASLLAHLSKLAKEADVKIVEIMELKGRQAEEGLQRAAKRPYDEVLIGINMRAGYHQLGKFINYVETQAPLMKIHDIHVKADPRSPREHNVKLIVSAFILE